ncbi:MAG: NAD(+) synthase, partial [Proteobacteria bacterium]
MNVSSVVERKDKAEPTLPRTDARIEASAPRAAEAISRSLMQSGEEFRVAIAQIRCEPGCIKLNTDKIISKIDEARSKGAKLVVFPELAIPGYCSMDLFFNADFIRENIQALQRVREASHGISVVVGFVDTDHNGARAGARPILYNSAAIISDGKIVAIQDKSCLPNYDIFFEDRYFAPPRARRVTEVAGLKLGVEICEDLWREGYPEDVTADLVSKGADVVVNLSASPFHLGKLATRKELISDTSRSQQVPIIYANLIGCYDGYEGDVIFDGRSMFMTKGGRLGGIARSFDEELLIVDLLQAKEIELPEVREVEELHDALVLGIRDFMARVERLGVLKRGQVVLGLSGGIDSAVVAALAAEALSPDRVLAISMPSQYSSNETRSDAEKIAENLGIRLKTVPIEETFKRWVTELKSDPDIEALPEDVSEENLQARIRANDLMFYANKLGGVVLNTGNKTELALNNCTMYGDTVGTFSVLGDVDKDRVYDLARFINERAGREAIPLSTIERAPSAELKPNQIDAHVMGADPQVMAPLVREIIEQRLSLRQAIERFG